MVINLTDLKSGTVFVSPGMESDDRLFVKISFDKIEIKRHIFKMVDAAEEGSIIIPSNVIGKSSDSVNIDLSYGSYNFTFSCFSRIYNDE